MNKRERVTHVKLDLNFSKLLKPTFPPLKFPFNDKYIPLLDKKQISDAGERIPNPGRVPNPSPLFFLKFFASKFEQNL